MDGVGGVLGSDAVISIDASHHYDPDSIPAWGICGVSYQSIST